MKQGHLSLIFLVIFVACWSFLYVKQKQYDLVAGEKQRIEQALKQAIENTAENFSEVIYASEAKKKEVLEREFPGSLCFAMGIEDTEENRETIRMHLPMLVLAEEDGAYFCYMEEQERDTITELVSVWSDKLVFPYKEESTAAEKRRILVETLEEKASDIINNHNYIAEQYGLTYLFSVPRFLENYNKELEFPMLFVVFQGWPLDGAGSIVYDNCLDAGLYMKRTKCYSVSKPEDILSPYFVYHNLHSQCVERENLIAEFISEEDAIRQYGAIPCKNCIP